MGSPWAVLRTMRVSPWPWYRGLEHVGRAILALGVGGQGTPCPWGSTWAAAEACFGPLSESAARMPGIGL